MTLCATVHVSEPVAHERRTRDLNTLPNASCRQPRPHHRFLFSSILDRWAGCGVTGLAACGGHSRQCLAEMRCALQVRYTHPYHRRPPPFQTKHVSERITQTNVVHPPSHTHTIHTTFQAEHVIGCGAPLVTRPVVMHHQPPVWLILALVAHAASEPGKPARQLPPPQDLLQPSCHVCVCFHHPSMLPSPAPCRCPCTRH